MRQAIAAQFWGQKASGVRSLDGVSRCAASQSMQAAANNDLIKAPASHQSGAPGFFAIGYLVRLAVILHRLFCGYLSVQLLTSCGVFTRARPRAPVLCPADPPDQKLRNQRVTPSTPPQAAAVRAPAAAADGGVGAVAGPAAAGLPGRRLPRAAGLQRHPRRSGAPDPLPPVRPATLLLLSGCRGHISDRTRGRMLVFCPLRTQVADLQSRSSRQ